ncbi:hypothetical protein JCGZ_21564 [Jatropha curcas]|uniref:Uncharacterized protein n=1 Tax=Jatropha curcas TaxID=180498 RepID=A0A067JEA1_JATCU|nr:hypothetical protein JCGZ_21564 [Jatropha curcas]
MANIICLASAICFLSLFGLAYGEAKFNVEGVVYCDTCRVQFMTKVTTLIEGATVHLECFNRTGDVLTYTSPEAVTDAAGKYSIPVEGDHEDELCQVMLLKSPNPDCATVHLECFNRTGDVLTYTSPEAVTDAAGKYSIPVEGDHEDELCQVMLLKSPNPDCNEINKDPFVRESASVTLTNDNGIAGPAREANPLGFLKKEILPECPEVLRELGITPSGLVP